MPSGGIDAARKFRGCCKSLPTLTPLSRLNMGIVTMGEKSLCPLWVISGHNANVSFVARGPSSAGGNEGNVAQAASQPVQASEDKAMIRRLTAAVLTISRIPTSPWCRPSSSSIGAIVP